jgi:cell wall-associated NlpC family hydrolase
VPALLRLRNLVVLPLLTLAVVAGVTVLGPVADASAASRTQRTHRAATVALQQVGDPYRYGAAGPNAFDCSGLMQYAFRKVGISLPRTSSAQAHRAHHISKKKLRRGDLMFFTRGGGVYHAAMFLRWKKGRAIMVHAPSPGQRVRIEAAWTSSWFAATMR